MSTYRKRARGAAPVRTRAESSAAGEPLVTAQIRADVARFFIDLRRAIGATSLQIAAQLRTHAGVIAALERADVETLPPWPETQRVVLGYVAWAEIDGRPVLSALAALYSEAEHRRQMAQRFAAVRPAIIASAERLRHASIVFAEGAKRLPREALNQARERPARTFYALSLPLGLVLALLNSNVLAAAAQQMPRPVVRAAVALQDALAVRFPAVREGLRWIEVADPRSRRADKLPPNER